MTYSHIPHSLNHNKETNILTMKLIFTFIAMLLPVFGSAESFFKNGTSWNTRIFSATTPEGEESLATYYLDGEASIDGLDALKLYRTIVTENRKAYTELLSHIREENNEVWYWSDFNQQWLLMYDFNLNEGDGTYIYQFFSDRHKYAPQKYYFKCVKTEVIDGLKHMRLEQYSVDPDNTIEPKPIASGTWIAGVGSANGVENNIFGMDGAISYLLDVVCDNKQVYKANTTSIDIFEPSAEVVGSEYYDLSGRHVAAPARGLYLRRDRLSDGTSRTVKVALP